MGIYLVGDQEHSANSGVWIAVEVTEKGCRQGSSLDSCLWLVAHVDQPEVESLGASVNIRSQQLMQEEREWVRKQHFSVTEHELSRAVGEPLSGSWL